MERTPLFRTAVILVALAAALYLFSAVLRVADFLFDLILMVFLAWIMASSVRRLAARVQRLTHLPTAPAVGLSYLLIFLPVLSLLILVVPLAIGQAVELSRSLPALAEDAPQFLERIQGIASAVGIQVQLADVYPKDLLSTAAASMGTWLSSHALDIAQQTLATLFIVILTLILSVYMALEGGRLADVLFRLLPRNWHDEAQFIYGEMDSIFAAWLRGVLIIGSIFALAILVIMLVMGAPYAVPIAILGGLLVIIPFIGDFIAIGLPTVAALTSGKPDAFTDAAVIGGFLLVWDILVINMFVSPRVIGGAVRLPTVLVILSVLLGAKIAGPWGSFLSVPVAAIIYATSIAFADRARRGTHALERAAEE